MTRQQLVAVVVLLVIYQVTGHCVPGGNCKAPDCRCWNDPAIPGGLRKADTPQMVLLSYEYAVNRANFDNYIDLLDGVMNPNNCPLKTTFFVQELYTDFAMVKSLYDLGHEIAITSTDGSVPEDWLSSYRKMRTAIRKADIRRSAIRGSRAPGLHAGGESMFYAMDKLRLSYDSSCATTVHSTKDKTLWPYTYDFQYDSPKCNIGEAPTGRHPGKWQFLVAAYHFKGQTCATLSGCAPFIRSSQDAFDFLFEAFSTHYDGSRSPFVLFIDPLWLSVDYQYEGTKQFIEFVRAAFEDTWFVSHKQALDWIKNPVPSSKTRWFKPWRCPNVSTLTFRSERV